MIVMTMTGITTRNANYVTDIDDIDNGDYIGEDAAPNTYNSHNNTITTVHG